MAANAERRSWGIAPLAFALAALFCAETAAASELAARVEEKLSAGPLARATVAVHVLDLADGRVLYSRNAARRLIVASNAKLVTAAAALEALGEHYEFTTALYGTGPVAGGVLRGDLVLRGGGDPTIGGRHDEEDALAVMRRWARVLRARGIERIEGGVVADDAFFDRTFRHPDWGGYPAWKWYYAPVSASSINDNCVTMTVRPGGAPGAAAMAEVHPASAAVSLRVTCTTSADKHAVWFDREPGSWTVRVGGRIRAGREGYSHEVTVPDPPLYAARALRQALEAEGIAVGGPARVAPAARPPAVRGEPLLVRRAALAPVLRRMVKRSHNHYAEQVFKTIGAEAVGRGSWPSGAARAEGVLRELGFTDGQFQVADGSGLSRNNRHTAELLAALLWRMRKGRRGADLTPLLAVAGLDGTLDGRLAEAPYAGNVRAKTGYLNGVGALSGYATARSGRQVAFSILINDTENPPGTYSMSRTVDELCRLIVDHAP